MSICKSSILMGAFTAAIMIADISHSRNDRLIKHFFLGSIVTVLFFTMCQYGYESINWILLLSVPLYILIKWLFTWNIYSSGEMQSYDTCNEQDDYCSTDSVSECISSPKCVTPSTCSASPTCVTPRPLPPSSTLQPPSGCPANPIRLPTACGISRYT